MCIVGFCLANGQKTTISISHAPLIGYGLVVLSGRRVFLFSSNHERGPADSFTSAHLPSVNAVS